MKGARRFGFFATALMVAMLTLVVGCSEQDVAAPVAAPGPSGSTSETAAANASAGKSAASSSNEIRSNSSKPVVIFLHARILEDLGEGAVSPRFGRYDYRGILQRFSDAGMHVVAEQRGKNADVDAHADAVVAKVRALLKQGRAPRDITVIGTSKGAVIASLVSTRLKERELRYVVVAGCYDGLERDLHPRFTGRVLSLYEKDDELGGSCRAIAALSEQITEFNEVQLDTRLGHAVLFRPIDAWMVPTIEWARDENPH